MVGAVQFAVAVVDPIVAAGITAAVGISQAANVVNVPVAV
jgi:L-alanine-DL-glutamate epimerase-like enolase superfamily enzyme